MLPLWAQTVSHANPIMYMVNAFRFGFFGVSDVNVPAAFAIMIGLAVLLFMSAVMMMNAGRGIRD
jgi:ABC-2 type transport system permease protein